MRIRCPHCRNAIEIVEDSSFRDVECPSCGSHFSLVGGDDTTESYRGQQKTIGHFELIERVGVGAHGSVWKAKDTKLDRTVAIKIPRKDQLTDVEAELFLRDARAAAQLNHPNLVSVHEVGKEDGSIYIVSDYVEGADLQQWLRGQPLPSREAAELMVKIANAVRHAHEHGVVHRDLKPANIMMSRDGDPQIMDFGLAKRETGEVTMTVDGATLGTPAYMSPEQARGKAHEADARSDVYSLGVMLYEMLTGTRPFHGEKRMLLVQIQEDEPPAPRRLNRSVPKDLETITLKCLRKEPSKRYQTASEIAEDLRRWLDQEPIKARPVSSFERARLWSRRNPLAAGTSASLLIAAIVILVVVLLAAREVSEANRRELEERTEKLAALEEKLSAPDVAAFDRGAGYLRDFVVAQGLVDAQRGNYSDTQAYGQVYFNEGGEYVRELYVPVDYRSVLPFSSTHLHESARRELASGYPQSHEPTDDNSLLLNAEILRLTSETTRGWSSTATQVNSHIYARIVSAFEECRRTNVFPSSITVPNEFHEDQGGDGTTEQVDSRTFVSHWFPLERYYLSDPDPKKTYQNLVFFHLCWSMTIKPGREDISFTAACIASEGMYQANSSFGFYMHQLGLPFNPKSIEHRIIEAQELDASIELLQEQWRNDKGPLVDLLAVQTRRGLRRMLSTSFTYESPDDQSSIGRGVASFRLTPDEEQLARGFLEARDLAIDNYRHAIAQIGPVGFAGVVGQESFGFNPYTREEYLVSVARLLFHLVQEEKYYHFSPELDWSYKRSPNLGDEIPSLDFGPQLQETLLTSLSSIDQWEPDDSYLQTVIFAFIAAYEHDIYFRATNGTWEELRDSLVQQLSRARRLARMMGDLKDAQFASISELAAARAIVDLVSLDHERAVSIEERGSSPRQFVVYPAIFP